MKRKMKKSANVTYDFSKALKNMKPYTWYLKQKRRVKKKYHFFFNVYYSPKQGREATKTINDMRIKSRIILSHNEKRRRKLCV